MFRVLKLKLRESLERGADPTTKAWWENYVKGSAPFMGVGMSAVRRALHQWHKAEIEGRLEYPAQMELALSLFDELYTEQKLAGILFLREILVPAGVINYKRDIIRFAELFTDGRIHDWNVCDWFCVKVLGPLIGDNGFDCARRIAQWRKAENIWQARACLVPFVTVADNNLYYPTIEDSCRVLIRREERFAKTAVGWILRDVSKHDKSFVKRLIEDNIRHFSAESLGNATKYFEKDERNQFRKMRHRPKVKAMGD